MEVDVPGTIAPWREDRGRCWEGRCPGSCCGGGSSDLAHFPGWTSSGNLQNWDSSVVKSPSCVFSFRAAAGTRRPRRFQKHTVQHSRSPHLRVKGQNISDNFRVCIWTYGVLCSTTTALWVRYISFEVKIHTSTTACFDMWAMLWELVSLVWHTSLCENMLYNKPHTHMQWRSK